MILTIRQQNMLVIKTLSENLLYIKLQYSFSPQTRLTSHFMNYINSCIHTHTKIFCKCKKIFTTLMSSNIVNYLYKLAHYEQGSSHIKSDETVNNFILDAIALLDTCISQPVTQNRETHLHQEHILLLSSRKRDIIYFPGVNFLTHSCSNFHKLIQIPYVQWIRT